MGFVLGPALSTLFPNLSTRAKIRCGAVLPLLGATIALLLARETKKDVWLFPMGRKKLLHPLAPRPTATQPVPLERNSLPPAPLVQSPSTTSSLKRKDVRLLVLNGFLIMFSFATESIYPVFAKDCFGVEERSMSGLLAATGLVVGVCQVSLIKPLIASLGKHVTLACGDLLLAIGLIGIALERRLPLHRGMFICHVLGYALADTALASLVIRYSDASSQGKNLALSQAAQACARILSPLFAGYFYELNRKKLGPLPAGAMPFLIGAAGAAVAAVVPLVLLVHNRVHSNNQTNSNVEAKD